jgi:hypothetical protein
MLGAKTTKKQNETVAGLVKQYENHDAWIDFVTTTNDARVYVMFTSPFESSFSYVIAKDGSTESRWDK